MYKIVYSIVYRIFWKKELHNLFLFCFILFSSWNFSIFSNISGLLHINHSYYNSAFAQTRFMQGLPEFPEEPDKNTPILEPQDLIPEKPFEGETLPNILQDQNAAERKAAELDRLFILLKKTSNVDEAAKISRQIQGLWAQSGSDTVDLLFQWAEDGIVKEDYAMALDFIDNIIAIEPNFSESWLRRAAIHVQLNDLKLAMYDLNQALKLEPRNYNAMALLGTIMEMTGRNHLALEIYENSLIYYPQNRRIQSRIMELIEKETDRAI